MDNDLNRNKTNRHVITLDPVPTIVRPTRNPSPLFPGWGPKLFALAIATVAFGTTTSAVWAGPRIVPSAADRIPPGLGRYHFELRATPQRPIVVRLVPSAGLPRFDLAVPRFDLAARKNAFATTVPWGYGHQANPDRAQPYLPLPRIGLPKNAVPTLELSADLVRTHPQIKAMVPDDKIPMASMPWFYGNGANRK